MFLGEFHNRLDTKGRMSVPVRFREELETPLEVVVKPGLDGCLYLLPLDTWETQAQAIRDQISPTTYQKRYLKRLLLLGAERVRLDRLGRVVLSPSLRRHSEIQRDVVILGLVDHVEIWAKHRWTEYRHPKQGMGPTEEILEQLADELPKEHLRFL